MSKEQKNTRQVPRSAAGSSAARQAARRKRRIRRRIIRATIVLTVLLLLLLLVALLVLRISGKVAQQNGTAASVMAVKAIEVEGDTRYSDEEIINASGIYVGESLLVINKVQAHNAILKQFPYLAYVDVGNSSFSTIRIQVRETRVMGVVETADSFLVVGENNHALERITEEEALPAETIRIKGAALLGEEIGEELLDERSLQVSRTLLEAAEQYELTHLTAIDMTERTNIRLMWKGQIQVILGNESNLALQVKALTGILPTLLSNNGETATGRLDMSSYADDDASNDRAVFSAMTLDELTTPPQSEQSSTEDEETDSTTPERETADTTDTTVGSPSATVATE